MSTYSLAMGSWGRDVVKRTLVDPKKVVDPDFISKHKNIKDREIKFSTLEQFLIVNYDM